MGFVRSRRRARRSLAAGLALAAASVVAPALAGDGAGPRAAAEAQRPVGGLRVMVVGDSISQGQTGSASWRYWLWREARRQGADLQLVGPARWPARGTWYEHLDHGFGEQTRHAARAGSGYPWHLERIAERVATHRPHVVLTELGFNDLRVGSPGTSRETARLALAYTRAVLDADPDVRLVLAEIPGRAPGPRGSRSVAAAKTRLAAETDARIDRKLARLGSPRVSRADLRTHPARPWRPRHHTYDGVHANSTGETLLAERFADALHALGHLPRPGDVFHREPWQPRPRFTSRQERQGATALWWRRDAARIHADTYVARVRVGSRVRRFAPRRSGAIVVTLPPGRYAVRMVARRGSMTSVPGPPAWVRVR